MNRNEIIEKIFSCPKCKSQMYISDNGKSVFCRGERHHCYDFSADGYLALGQGGGDSKEAVAFAVLGYETMNRRPGNLPAATGANGPVILGSITY